MTPWHLIPKDFRAYVLRVLDDSRVDDVNDRGRRGAPRGEPDRLRQRSVRGRG